MKVLFLVESLESASARTRALDLVAPLRARGIAVTVLPWSDRDAASSADVVVLARKLPAEGPLAELRRAARALVFDVDDAVDVRPFDVAARGRSWSRPRRFADVLRAADLVVAGSGHLRDLARARGHERVRVLPPAVAIPPTVSLERSTGDGLEGPPVVLVWTGARSTLGYLVRLAPALGELARRRPRVRLEVVADVEPPPLGLPLRFVPWSLEAEAATLAGADVGLMPLEQDPWSLGKCGHKLALYQAQGLASVSSRFGGGAEVLDAPETGLLADDEGEWLRALERLVSEPGQRRAMGVRARAHAAATLSLDVRAAAWASVLREAQRVGSLT